MMISRKSETSEKVAGTQEFEKSMISGENRDIRKNRGYPEIRKKYELHHVSSEPAVVPKSQILEDILHADLREAVLSGICMCCFVCWWKVSSLTSEAAAFVSQLYDLQVQVLATGVILSPRPCTQPHPNYSTFWGFFLI